MPPIGSRNSGRSLGGLLIAEEFGSCAGKYTVLAFQSQFLCVHPSRFWLAAPICKFGGNRAILANSNAPLEWSVRGRQVNAKSGFEATLRAATLRADTIKS